MRSHSPLQDDGGQRARHFRKPILEFIQRQFVIAFLPELVGQVALIKRRGVVLEPLTQAPFRQATGNPLFCDRQPAATTSWCTSWCTSCFRFRFGHTLPLSLCISGVLTPA